MLRAPRHVLLAFTSLVVTARIAAADPELCDYKLTATGATTPTTTAMPCTLRAVKVAAGTTYYKGGWDSSTWKITGGYVSDPVGAVIYARQEPGPGRVVYSAKTKADAYLIDIRDVWTLKALFGLPNATVGFDRLRGQSLAFDAARIDALFGLFIDRVGVFSVMFTRCDPKVGTATNRGQPQCYLDEFDALKSSATRASYASYVKLVTDLPGLSWAAAQGLTLLRNSLFLLDDKNNRIVPDTTIMDPLCPYLSALGFAGWYGAADVPVDVFGNVMVEESYFCWEAKAFTAQTKTAASGWSTLAPTAAPGAPADVYPAGIVKIGGRVVSTSTASTTRP